MGAGKTVGSGWQHIRITLRSDIVAAAQKEKIDISSECNKALAQRLEIGYPTPRQVSVDSKVIVAPDNVPVKRSVQKAAAPPVINAEDPTVPGKVLREKKERKMPVVTKPQEGEHLHMVNPSVQAAPASPASKPKKKGKKEEAIKRFVSTRIVREAEDSPDAIIPKDELYQRFERWCRDQSYSFIPEHRVFSVTLKNKFAFTERIVGGTPSWISIRIK
ncbi:MAG: hypothetical protein WCC86_01740 [Methanoregula sp.]|uniref:hypothetical protein n=1 Tax=Methanoregula sp. TaxID=2052170 RepID=UPI003BAE9CEC